MESGRRAGADPNAPDSYTSSSSGATVRLARLHAMFGGPTPTKHTRSPASCRADATIIISAGEYPVEAIWQDDTKCCPLPTTHAVSPGRPLFRTVTTHPVRQ